MTTGTQDAITGREILFSPIDIRTLRLRNRIVMSPMTRQQAAGGILFESDYYAKRAAGGCGLIITEGVAIDHAVADFTNACPQIATPEQIASWRKTVDDVHAAGAPIVMQLWHTGIRRPTAQSFRPDLPSASPSGDYPTGEWPYSYDPIDEAEIEAIIDAYARTAAAAKGAGFDGVEIHAAHGYLPDQFFWSITNRRTDRWGGDVSGRVRFAAEVVRAIRRATGPDYPIFLRFSQWKLDRYDARLAETPVELAAYLEPLADAGVDVFDASTRRFWTPEFDGSDLNLAGWARKITGRAAMTVGSVGLEGPLEAAAKLRHEREPSVAPAGLEALYARLERGEFDLVGVGRALLANADWANLIRDERFDALSAYTAEVAATAVI